MIVIVIFRKCFQNICENIFGMFAKIFSECLRKYFRNVCENSLVSTLQAGDEEAARITVTDSSFKGTVSRDLFNVLYLSINSMHTTTIEKELNILEFINMNLPCSLSRIKLYVSEFLFAIEPSCEKPCCN